MALLLQIVIAFTLYLMTKAFYNLKFHSLASYPGPKLWVLSRIPYLVSMNTGRFPFRVKQLHDEYDSKVIRVSADEISFNDSRAWKDIFNRKDLLRPPQWGARPPGVEAFNVISARATDHARFRKALTPAYSEARTREYEPIVRFYVEKLMSRFDERITQGKGSAVVDFVKWANFTTFDIIGELSWSKSYQCLETGTGHAFMSILLHFQAVLIGASIGYYSWLNTLVAKITPKSAFQMLENVFEDGRQRLRARIQLQTVNHPDLMAHIIDYNSKASPEDKLSDAEIEQNVLAILIGGSETLTTIFSGALHYLLADRTKLAKITEEVRGKFASKSDINATSVASLPYLNAVINETLRMCPPIPDMLRRVVPEAITIAGHVMPPGTTVSVSCYSMFKSSEYFSAPEIFEPERFIARVNNHETRSDSPLFHNDLSAFRPFSMGAHNCLGQPLAWLEMRLLLALFFYSYDVKVPSGHKLRDWTSQKIYWTWEKQPLMVEISKA
ncbi:cytochrome P450 [Massariosphaeria phaeospora]|uniref:Cytochrome P450 n=1 Tax=Massariosphaeria phaeospora TaxID=100035 RepID=A0A7C8MGX3_9PLEO|nr:cytochrome P450 [Massariosphaeria phaeospora]